MPQQDRLGDLASAHRHPAVVGAAGPWNRRCIAAVWGPWPASTRLAAAPVRGRWWSLPASWGPIAWRVLLPSMTPKAHRQGSRGALPLIRRYALAYHVVFIPAAEVDVRGVHAANIEGMRRAVAGCRCDPVMCSPMGSGCPVCPYRRCR